MRAGITGSSPLDGNAVVEAVPVVGIGSEATYDRARARKRVVPSRVHETQRVYCRDHPEGWVARAPDDDVGNAPAPALAAPAPVASAPVVTEASPVSLDTQAIDEFLRHMVAAGASDLHLSAGAVPVLRVHGEIKFLSERGALGSNDVEKLVLYSIMEDDVRNTFE